MYRETLFSNFVKIRETFVNIYDDYSLGYLWKDRQEAIENSCDKPIYRIHVIPKIRK